MRLLILVPLLLFLAACTSGVTRPCPDPDPDPTSPCATSHSHTYDGKP